MYLFLEGPAVCNKKNLNYINQIIVEYKNSIIYIEKLLCEYVSEDKNYLFSEHNRLKEKIKNFEVMLRTLPMCDEEAQRNLEEYSEQYLDNLKVEFCDFLIILRWNNFSAIRKKLRSICKQPSISFSERKNYLVLLNKLSH
jgi:hypothetical protein